MRNFEDIKREIDEEVKRHNRKRNLLILGLSFLINFIVITIIIILKGV